VPFLIHFAKIQIIEKKEAFERDILHEKVIKAKKVLAFVLFISIFANYE